MSEMFRIYDINDTRTFHDKFIFQIRNWQCKYWWL